jgi:hypothetical protein
VRVEYWGYRRNIDGLPSSIRGGTLIYWGNPARNGVTDGCFFPYLSRADVLPKEMRQRLDAVDGRAGMEGVS